MSARELLPCPFCGKANLMSPAGFERATSVSTVHCHACGATSGMYKTPEDAIEAWNRRAHLSEPVRARELTREQIASIRYTLAGDGEGSYQAEDINALCDMALASLEPVAMPPYPATMLLKWGVLMEAGKNDIETYRKVVLREDYDALRAWAARGELSDARIREIAEQWFGKGFGDHYDLMQDACAEAIRQALGGR